MPSQIYSCQEYEEVDILISEVVREGVVDVYPEVLEQGLFDIDYRRNELRLVSKGYVGLIPINSRIALRVLPRFPISHLFYLLVRSGSSVKNVPGFRRSYQILSEDFTKVDHVVGQHFVDTLMALGHDGVLRRYVSEESKGSLRGRLLFSKSVKEAFARGAAYRQIREGYMLSDNIVENRILRKVIRGIRDSLPPSAPLRRKTDRLLALFERVPEATNKDSPEALLRALEAKRFRNPELRAAAWLAYLIESRKGLSLTSLGVAETTTLLVNMADVFEGYIRQVIRDHFSDRSGVHVRNGNEHPLPLFASKSNFKVMPDVYVVRPKASTLVFDAKYKPKRTAADRYEVLAFCQALKAKCAIIVAPVVGQPLSRSTLLGTTHDGVSLYEIFFNLQVTDIEAEERAFKAELGRIGSKYD